MSEPTIITDHSDAAIARLIDFFRGKENVEKFLRCKSAARINVKNAVEGEEYLITVNDCRLSYTPERNDTPPDVAAEFVDLINSGGGQIDRDTFDRYELGLLGDQLGPFGTWQKLTAGFFGSLVDISDLIVNNVVALSLPNSIRSNYDQPLPPTEPGAGTTWANGNYLINYYGATEDIQRVEYWFKFDDGWPGVVTSSTNEYFFSPVLDVFMGGGPALIYWLALSVGNISFSMDAGIPGTGPFRHFDDVPFDAIVDGQWHKLLFEFDRTGTYIKFELDNGDWGGTDVGVGPMPSNMFVMGCGYANLEAAPWPGYRNVYKDNLKLGSPRACGVDDPATFVGNSPESFEGYIPGNRFDGPGVYATWTETLPGHSPGPPWTPPYLGGYIVTNSDARTGSNSIRTDMVSAGIGPDVGGGPQVFNAGLTYNYPGQINDFQSISIWFKTPGSSFPGATFEASGGTVYPVALAIMDLSTFVILLASIGVKSIDSYANYWFDIAAVGLTGSTPITIPRASLDDGQWHKITMEFFRSGGIITATIDDSDIWTTTMPLPYPPLNITVAGLLSHFSGLSGTTAVVGDFLLDDLVVGGTIGKKSEIKAKQLTPDDDYFYLFPRETGGLKIDVFPDDESKMNYNRIGVVDQLQEIENVSFDVLTDRWLNTAEGFQLNQLGLILGRPRTGDLSDAEFRQLLGVQIAKNLSSGEADRLINVAATVTGSAVVELIEYFPGFVDIGYSGEAVNPATLLTLLDSVAAGGVRIDLNQIPEHPFGFLGDPNAFGFNDGEFAGTPGAVPGGPFPGPEQIEDFSAFNPGDQIAWRSGPLGYYRRYPRPGAVAFGPLNKQLSGGKAEAILNDRTLNQFDEYSKGTAIVVPNNPEFSLWTANHVKLATNGVSIADPADYNAEMLIEILALSSFDFNESGTQNIKTGIRIGVDLTTRAATIYIIEDNIIVNTTPLGTLGPGSVSAIFNYNRLTGYVDGQFGAWLFNHTITPFDDTPIIGIVFSAAVKWNDATPGIVNINPTIADFRLKQLE